MQNQLLQSTERPIAGAGGARPKRKPPAKLYRVADVVDYSGMSRQTIHNYTMMGILHEKGWTKGGHRLYGEEVFERLDKIAEFKINRKSMEFIREYFARLDLSQETREEHPQ